MIVSEQAGAFGTHAACSSAHTQYLPQLDVERRPRTFKEAEMLLLRVHLKGLSLVAVRTRGPCCSSSELGAPRKASQASAAYFCGSSTAV